MITDKIQLKQNISSSIYIFDSLCHHDLGLCLLLCYLGGGGGGGGGFGGGGGGGGFLGVCRQIGGHESEIIVFISDW